RQAFFSTKGVRWTEFARLKYFDLVRYTVVDPMHNLLLGVAKTQWYTQWIKTGALRADTANYHRELNVIHEFLENFEAPLWAGRLPLRVGEPAGGSLTANEYKFAQLLYTTSFPFSSVLHRIDIYQIPVVWDRFLKEAQKDFTTSNTSYRSRSKDYEKNMRTWESGPQSDPPPEPPKRPFQRMLPEEDRNFLRFSALLKILIGSAIRINALPRLYGGDRLKPNHHYAVHSPDQVLDYGPLNGFWAFLTERLNKILKNLNSNNWTGGRLEVSMMREFHRNTAINTIVRMVYSHMTDY
ncbi:hypothetical protein C8R45DRAFT_826624, partial [Mycena sanguinolenta]